MKKNRSNLKIIRTQFNPAADSVEANPPTIPPHLDDPMIYLHGVPVKVGLEAQGHIPTIEAMLKDWGYSHKYVWDAIGKKIGWCPFTACASYVNYLLRHD